MAQAASTMNHSDIRGLVRHQQAYRIIGSQIAFFVPVPLREQKPERLLLLDCEN